MHTRLPAAIAALAFAAITKAQSLQYLGSFSSPNAGFLSIDNTQASTSSSLIISAFTGNPFAADNVNIVYDIGSYLTNISNAGPATVTLSNNITWPNTVTTVDPAQVPIFAPSKQGFIVSGGFLVPPKCVGAITAVELIPTTTTTSTDVSTFLQQPDTVSRIVKLSVDDGDALFGGYFYHRSLFHDVDGDGYLDLLSARAIKPLIGPSNGQLVWLRNPTSASTPDPLAPTATPWQETVLVNGTWSPDVLWTLTNLRNDDDQQIFFTSFFTGGGLGMVLCSGCNSSSSSSTILGNTWSNASGLSITVLDASIGPSFDVQVIDLNGDGRLDLLVTNHVDNATDGGTPASGIFAYEAPLAPTPLTDVSAWTKHTLAIGFAVREWGPNQAAPGSFKAFYPCGGATSSSKPIIVLAGDGDQRIYTLTPTSMTDPLSWNYTLVEIFDCKGTVGAPVIGDVNGDGCVEMFVPCYDSGIVQAWSYTA